MNGRLDCAIKALASADSPGGLTACVKFTVTKATLGKRARSAFLVGARARALRKLPSMRLFEQHFGPFSHKSCLPT